MSDEETNLISLKNEISAIRQDIKYYKKSQEYLDRIKELRVEHKELKEFPEIMRAENLIIHKKIVNTIKNSIKVLEEEKKNTNNREEIEIIKGKIRVARAKRKFIHKI